MTPILKSKLTSLLLALAVLVIFYILDPDARDISTFTANYKRTIEIEECAKKINNATTTSHVLHVIDGDTIEILTPGCKTENVRMLGINTPESVDPRRPVECFGPEASHKAFEILSDKEVIIKGDPTQDIRDKYGRLLAYVFLPDGTLFNKYMVEEGYAYEYTYFLPYTYQKEFKDAEIMARSGQKGLWSPMTCNGIK